MLNSTEAIPTSAEVVEAARVLVESTSSWKPGKVVGNVQTFSRKSERGGPAWHGRVSQHTSDEVTFDRLWAAVGTDHFTHEKEYIPAISRVELLKSIGSGEIWALHYTFPKPVSPRVFTEFQVTHLDDTDSDRRVGYVVTVPFDVEKDEEMIKAQGKAILGKYVSVERVTEKGDGTVEWRMVTCSTPAGSIPLFISEMSIPGQIAHDVPLLLKWLKSKPSS